MKFLRDQLDDEGGAFKDRPSCLKFESWILFAGRAIRGSKRKALHLSNSSSNANTNGNGSVSPSGSDTFSAQSSPKRNGNGSSSSGGVLSPQDLVNSDYARDFADTVEGQSDGPPLAVGNGSNGGLGDKPRKPKKARSVLYSRASLNNASRAIGINIFAEMFMEDDELIWPLQLIDPNDREQFKTIYPLLNMLPHTVMFYLNDIIFPEVLAHQGLKLSSCGQVCGCFSYCLLLFPFLFCLLLFCYISSFVLSSWDRVYYRFVAYSLILVFLLSLPTANMNHLLHLLHSLIALQRLCHPQHTPSPPLLHHRSSAVTCSSVAASALAAPQAISCR
jgi:hypothetical protein